MGVEAIQIPQSLAQVINRAGDKSDVDFNYLVQTAMRESSLNPQAKAQTSSAVGLFQFTESTWLQVMKQDGDRLGYSNYVQAIEINEQGRYVVRDNELRQEILSLREDPQISADLAAAFTLRNGEYLSSRFGRQPSPGELYIAHFMGAAGAERMFNAGLENPEQIAADLFPRQAQANRAIFYDSAGARTIREVYQSLVAKHAQGQVVAPPEPLTARVNSSQPLQQSSFQEASSQQIPPQAVPDQKAPVSLLQTPNQVEISFTSLFATQGTQPTQGAQPNSSRFVIVDPGATLFVQLYSK